MIYQSIKSAYHRFADAKIGLITVSILLSGISVDGYAHGERHFVGANATSYERVTCARVHQLLVDDLLRRARQYCKNTYQADLDELEHKPTYQNCGCEKRSQKRNRAPRIDIVGRLNYSCDI